MVFYLALEFEGIWPIGIRSEGSNFTNVGPCSSGTIAQHFVLVGA